MRSRTRGSRRRSPPEPRTPGEAEAPSVSFPPVRTAPLRTKRIVAITLAAVLVIAIALAAATTGLADPGIPSGAVAVVDGVEGGTVSQEQLDTALQQAAADLGEKEAPPPTDPDYETDYLGPAMELLLLPIWFEGEASERGITATQEEIDAELADIKKQSFSSEKEFQQFLRESDFSDADIQEQIKQILLQRKLREAVLPATDPADPSPQFTPEELASIYGVDDEAIQRYYDTNQEQFAQPATRDVRVIINSSQAKVEQARKALEADSSPASWKKVAAQYSQDPASKDRGGLLQGVTEDQNDPQLTGAAFAAAEGELVGPFETARGFALIQVEKATEATTVPLEKVGDQVRGTLLTNAQQETSSEFQAEFADKWTDRTICEPEVTTELCSNFEPPAPEQVEGQAFPPPVVSSSPIEPGTATYTGGAATQGAVQTPKRVGDECADPDDVEQAIAAGTILEGQGQVLDPCGPNDPAIQPQAAGQLPPGTVPIGSGGVPPSGAAPPPPAGAGTAPAPGAAPPTP